MDIRSIIDADPSTSTPKRLAQNNRDDNRHEIRPTLQTSSSSFQSPYGVPPPVYHASRDGRPPQPPPLQAPGHNDFRSPSVSSYHSIQSPYQPTPTSAVSGGQYPFPPNQHQSPYGAQGSHYSQRDGHPVGPHQSPMNVSYSQYGQPTPMPQTPTATTPGSSQTYYNQGRPPSSHSVTTPTSMQPQAPQIPRQSPSTSHAQIRGQTQTFSAQQYLSQPGTPLGPPANFARSSTNLRRESPGSHGHSRNHSGGSHSHNSISVPSPSTEHPGSAFDSPSTIGHKQTQSSGRRQSTSLDRERSLSVSPKTRLPSQPKNDVLKGAADPYYAQRDLYSTSTRDSEHYRSEARNSHAQPANQTPSRSFSLDVNGILNAPMVSEHNRQTNELSGSATTISPQVITPPNRPPLHMRIPSQSDSRDMSDEVPNDVTPSKLHSTAQQTIHDRQSLHMPTTATKIASFHDRPPSPHQADSMPSIPSQDQMSASVHSKLADIKAEDKEPHASVIQPSARKRRREEAIPVYAQSSRSGPSKNPFLLGKRPVKATPPVKREQSMGNDLLRQTPAQASRPDTNGHTIPNNDVQIPTAHPPVPSGGLLGPWEPSILNHIPHEEVTKFVSDFLFNEVVLRHDVGVASNKGVHSQAAVLEIEAKIGQLKDTAYGSRLHLPVMSECVFCVTDPKYKTKFESSMTESQHRELNRFLNKALVNSKPQSAKTASNLARSRVEMDYAHTYETDTFYPLSQAGILTLPKSIRNQINPRDKKGQSVRVTTNNKTGQLIAQIIKVRVANLEIYSPGTLFDWRISVNVEMKIEGDFRQLIEPGDEGKTKAPRNKDRLSYKHSQYQIDLTQVTEADASKKHELEVEVASQEIRTQGQLALDGQPNQYEELVKGFVDNVRILVRHCKPE